MKSYRGIDLLERVIEAERLRERYRTDERYRLYQVNKARRRYGLPEVGSAAEINSRNELARRRQRDGAGRFI